MLERRSDFFEINVFAFVLFEDLLVLLSLMGGLLLLVVSFALALAVAGSVAVAGRIAIAGRVAVASEVRTGDALLNAEKRENGIDDGTNKHDSDKK